MRAMMRLMVVVSALALGMGVASAEVAKTAQPTGDPAKEAAMAAMIQYGTPGEQHKALEPFVGTWNYTLSWQMSPEAPSESMAGVTTTSWIFGGRFLKQDVTGPAAAEGQPSFEGIGFVGYDNIRKEYTSIWFDNMGTGIMLAAGQYDAATTTLTEEGSMSCPMTGESHRWFRSAWKIVDENHNTYETYTRTPDGREFKSMEIQYTRAQ